MLNYKKKTQYPVDYNIDKGPSFVSLVKFKKGIRVHTFITIMLTI